jgi:hypothetical protein
MKIPELTDDLADDHSLEDTDVTPENTDDNHQEGDGVTNHDVTDDRPRGRPVRNRQPPQMLTYHTLGNRTQYTINNVGIHANDTGPIPSYGIPVQQVHYCNYAGQPQTGWRHLPFTPLYMVPWYGPMGTIEVLHDHVTAAMLDGRNNEILLHENQFNSSRERDSIVLPSNMAALT